jgi:hypothetical protein
MKRSIKELEKIAQEIREALEKISQVGERGTGQIQDGFKNVTEAFKLMAKVLWELPDRLMKIARDLANDSHSDGRG